MFGGSSLQIILQIVFIGVLARILTPKDFGIVGIIMILVNFTFVFTQLGIGAALVQLKEITSQHISIGYSFAICIGLAFSLLFYFFAPKISVFFNIEKLNEPIQFFALFFPIKSFNSVSEALLQRKLKFDITVKCNSFSYIIGFGLVAILLAYFGYGYWSLIYGQFAQLLMYTFLLIYFEFPKFSLRLNKPILSQLSFFGSGHTLATLFNYFAENSDNIITGKLLGPASLGFYSRAFQFLSIPARFFGAIFDNVLFPVLSLKQDNRKKLAKFYIYSITFCFIILIPVSIFCIANAKYLILILLGPNWSQVILPFQILILGLSFRFATKINKSFLKSLGLVYWGAFYQFVFSILVVSLSYMGAKIYGIVGVAFAVFISTVINYFQICYKLRNVLSFSLKAFGRVHINSLKASVVLAIALAIILILSENLEIPLVAFISSTVIFAFFFFFIITSKRNPLFIGDNKIFTLMIIDNLPIKLKDKIVKTFIYRKVLN